MQPHRAPPSPAGPLLAVRAAEEFEYLVKQSEILTGRPGRIFVIASADRLRYRVQWYPYGLHVERLDEQGDSVHAQQLLPFEALEHPLLEAMHVAQLYTTPIEAGQPTSPTRRIR